MQIGYIGFGKMGLNMALRLKEKGHEVVGFNRGKEARENAKKEGIKTVDSLKDLVVSLSTPRFLWVMVSHQGVDEVLSELIPLLSKGDTVVDGGNCLYKDTIRRAKEIESRGINFLDIGVSGGPSGARYGACLMIGGKKEIAEKYISLYEDLSAPEAWKILGGHGAGHFTKMVHNGIEYGMMQAIGEGFEVLKKSEFDLSLLDVALIYNNKSVIESRLTNWLKDAYQKYGEDLGGISGEVSASGEGQWTVDTAHELSVPVKVIEDSLEFRKKSAGNPTYTGKVVSALRNQFGGHDVGEK